MSLRLGTNTATIQVIVCCILRIKFLKLNCNTHKLRIRTIVYNKNNAENVITVYIFVM